VIRENLLGYLLGALEDHEHEEVRRQIEQNPDLRHDLERMELHVRRLKSDPIEEHAPPLGLARRTCQFIDDQRVTVATRSERPAGMSPSPRERAAAASRWSRLDMIVALAIVFVSAGIFLPAISSSRQQSQIAGCQNNFLNLGRAYNSFSTFNAGMLPGIPTKENPATRTYSRAASIPMTLLKQKLLPSRRMLVCPTSPRKLQVRIIGVQLPPNDLGQMPEKKVILLFNTVGGTYAYNLGYLNEQGKYTAGKNRQRATYVMVSDTPRADRQGSDSHGRKGWNVLFEDGHAEFVTQCSIGGKDSNLFLNDQGKVEAGIHTEDAVVAPGGAMPIAQ